MKSISLLGIASLCSIGLSSMAFAQFGGTPQECRTFRDRLSCTCALENGGSIYPDPHRPGHMRWRSPKNGSAAHMAFMNCTSMRGVR
jgi:hypothetical protein